MTLTESKHAIARAGLVAVDVDGVEMFCTAEALDAVPDGPTDDVRVLPGFDEYLLGFKDRSMMLDDAHRQAIIPGNNGVFQPTIVQRGRVVGTWKRKSVLKAKTVLTVTPLVRLSKRDRAAVTTAFQPYSEYLGQPVELVWPD